MLLPAATRIISTFRQTPPTVDTDPGAVELRFDRNYDFLRDVSEDPDSLYLTEIVTIQAADSTGAGTSGFTTQTFLTPYGLGFSDGTALNTATGIEFLRVVIERIEGSTAPDTANPVTLVTTGPGIQDIAAEFVGPVDLLYIQPVGSNNTAVGATTHIALTVPAANQAILRATLQLKLYKLV